MTSRNQPSIAASFTLIVLVVAQLALLAFLTWMMADAIGEFAAGPPADDNQPYTNFGDLLLIGAGWLLVAGSVLVAVVNRDRPMVGGFWFVIVLVGLAVGYVITIVTNWGY